MMKSCSQDITFSLSYLQMSKFNSASSLACMHALHPNLLSQSCRKAFTASPYYSLLEMWGLIGWPLNMTTSIKTDNSLAQRVLGIARRYKALYKKYVFSTLIVSHLCRTCNTSILFTRHPSVHAASGIKGITLLKTKPKVPFSSGYICCAASKLSAHSRILSSALFST